MITYLGGELWIQISEIPLKNWPCVESCSCDGFGWHIYVYSVRKIPKVS